MNIFESMDFQAKLRACNLRKTYGFNENAPIDMESLYEMMGISMIKIPLRSAISGVFLRKDEIMVALINTSKALGHQNFTAAHELSHALYDTTINVISCNPESKTSDNQEVEKMADLFAVSLLMPEQGIACMLERILSGRKEKTITLLDILYLESFFKTSHLSTLLRLKNLGYITYTQCEKFRKDICLKAKMNGFSDSLYKPDRITKVISKFAIMVNEAYDKNIISEYKYNEMLTSIGISPEVSCFDS